MPIAKAALIVAGGSGVRMGSQIPKQFLVVCQRPVLMHTITAFYHHSKAIDIVLVIQKSQQTYWQELCQKYDFTIPHQIADGGATRFQSVKNGLALVKGEGLVAIHDAVRPCIDNSLLSQLYRQAEEKGSAVPCLPIVESVRKINSDGKNSIIDRNQLRTIQTPQVFYSQEIKACYQTQEKDFFTDDASVFESVTHKGIHLAEGSQQNIKITYAKDLKSVENFLST